MSTIVVGPLADREWARRPEQVRVVITWSDDAITVEGPFTKWFFDMYVLGWLAEDENWRGRPVRPVRIIVTPFEAGGIN